MGVTLCVSVSLKTWVQPHILVLYSCHVFFVKCVRNCMYSQYDYYESHINKAVGIYSQLLKYIIMGSCSHA